MKKSILLVISFLLLASSVYSKPRYEIIINGGETKSVGEDARYWEMGYNLGLDVYLKSKTRVSYGLRIAKCWFTPNGDEYLKRESKAEAMYYPYKSYDYDLTGTSGKLSIFGIVPVVRINLLKNIKEKVNINLITGFGIYELKSDIKVTGVYRDNVNRGIIGIYIEPGATSEAKPGFQIGALISLGDRLVITPYYNTVFTSGKYTNYATVDIGFKLSK